MLQWSVDGLALFKKLYRDDVKRMSSFAAFDSNHLGIVAADGRFDLYDGNLRVKDADGKIIFDQVKPADYHKVLAEEVRPWSYMKFPFIRELGPKQGWYRVGPLARVNICDYMDAPLAEKEREEFMKLGGGRMVNATMAYHWARLIELLYSAEKIQELLKDRKSVV